MIPLDPIVEARLQAEFSGRAVVCARAVARIAGIEYARVLHDAKIGRLRGAWFGKSRGFVAPLVREYLARPLG